MRAERGQTMVEFAIVLPVLLLIVFAIIQFGILFNNFVALTDAVRAGARTAAVSRTAANPVAATIARVQSATADLDQSKLGITVTSGWQHGDDVTVSATYPYSIDLFGVIVQAGNLKSSTTERVE
ncbi:MAG TPA: TadE/TadG family type IV pilus assembly protein [Gaiellaceae bacterium]|nr:TadE/TadG family type IV pilus assembly protein [Gaiellaceae bacterium]